MQFNCFSKNNSIKLIATSFIGICSTLLVACQGSGIKAINNPCVPGIWSSFSSSMTHNRVLYGRPGITPVLKWTYRIPGRPSIDSEAISSTCNDMYFTTDNGVIYRVSENGKLLNKRKYSMLPFSSGSPCLVDTDLVFIGDGRSSVIEFNGRLDVLKRKAISQVGPRGISCVNSYIVATTSDGVSILDTTDRLLWEYRTDRSQSGRYAAFSKGCFYIQEDFVGLICINTDGSLKWKCRLQGKLSSVCPVVYQDHVYVTTNRGYLCSIGVDGTLDWKFRINDTRYPMFNIPVVNDKNVYYTTPLGIVYCIDHKGSMKWKIDMSYITIGASPILFDDKYLLFVDVDAGVYSIDTTKGKLIGFTPANENNIGLAFQLSSNDKRDLIITTDKGCVIYYSFS